MKLVEGDDENGTWRVPEPRAAEQPIAPSSMVVRIVRIFLGLLSLPLRIYR